MNAASVATLTFALVAAWATALNFWVFALRREERGHFWLGVTGLGVSLMGIPSALLYASESLNTAVALRSGLTLGSIPFFVGLLRFTEIFLERPLRRAEHIAIPALFLSAVIPFVPGVLYSGEGVARTIAGFGIEYIDAQGSLFSPVIAVGYLSLSLYVVAQYMGRLPDESRDRRMILAAIGLFVVTMVHDIAVGNHLLDTPFLLILGYTGLVIAFTTILSRRFVESVVTVEKTADRLQEAALERTEALRQKDLQLAHGEALATVGTLAAGLAHEINNPIAFISANLNHLEELRDEPDCEAEFVEVLAETQEGVARIHSIVDELLRLARRQEGGTEEVDLTSVVESVLPIVRHEARGRANLRMHLEPVPPVVGDRRLLGQVVVNLVLNAIHSIPEAEQPGEVVIATTCDRPLVRLLVRDNGSGIPADVVPRIFEPFYTTKGSGEGTGLGLAITHQLVTRHGGRIDVDTGPAGTTMTVALPILGTPALTSSEGDREQDGAALV